MVAPLVYGIAAGSVALYAAYQKGKSSGKSEGMEKGKQKREEEMAQEYREEVKEEIKEEEISKEVKEEIKEKFRLEEKAKREFEEEQSWEAHQEAMKGDPPVDIGDKVELGVEEVKKHHSGSYTAVCRKEGFIIFVNGVPRTTEDGDVISAKITSFGEDMTSAQATYEELRD